MLKYLKPKSESNSISKAVATIFVPQAFIKPEDLLIKYSKIEDFDNFKKKTLLKAASFNIEKNRINQFTEKIQGLLFESYQSTGAIDSIFRLQNNTESKSSISVETRVYNRWNDFSDYFLKIFKSFVNHTEFYVEAISLNYQDEFEWLNDNEPIPCNLIFKNDSEFLNEKFLKGRNGSLVSLVQGNSEMDDIFFEERTELAFNNDSNRLLINHNFVFKLDDVSLYHDIEESIEELFNRAHEENKNVLNELLSDEVRVLIGMKK